MSQFRIFRYLGAESHHLPFVINVIRPGVVHCSKSTRARPRFHDTQRVADGAQPETGQIKHKNARKLVSSAPPAMPIAITTISAGKRGLIAICSVCK